MRRMVLLLKSLNLNILLFLLLIFSFGLTNAMHINGNQVSSIENRTLKTMPTFSYASLTSGKYMKEFEDYYGDNFVFREKLVKESKAIQKLKGLPSEDDVVIARGGSDLSTSDLSTNDKDLSNNVNNPNQVAGNQQAEEKPKDQPGNDSTVKDGSDNGAKEVVNNYIITSDSAIEIHFFKEHEYTKYAQALNALKQNFGDGVTMYSMVIPTAFEFLNNDKYKKLGDPESRGISTIYDNLDKSIIRINAYDFLKKNSDKYLYYRTDIHWTSLGAYYAYLALMAAKGEQPVALENYEQGKIDGYLGTLYGATLNPKLTKNPDTINYYKPFVRSQFYGYENGGKNTRAIIDFDAAKIYDKYCVFLGGLRVRGEISTETPNQKKLLVIKDSFGNAFIPFLLPHYQEIYIVDPRASDINVRNFVKDKGIQEVLVLNNVFSVTEYGFPQLIQKMASQ